MSLSYFIIKDICEYIFDVNKQIDFLYAVYPNDNNMLNMFLDRNIAIKHMDQFIHRKDILCIFKEYNITKGDIIKHMDQFIHRKDILCIFEEYNITKGDIININSKNLNILIQILKIDDLEKLKTIFTYLKISKPNIKKIYQKICLHCNIEIMKYIFDKYDIVHNITESNVDKYYLTFDIIHNFTSICNNFGFHDDDTIHFEKIKYLFELWNLENISNEYERRILSKCKIEIFKALKCNDDNIYNIIYIYDNFPGEFLSKSLLKKEYKLSRKRGRNKICNWLYNLRIQYNN